MSNNESFIQVLNDIHFFKIIPFQHYLDETTTWESLYNSFIMRKKTNYWGTIVFYNYDPYIKSFFWGHETFITFFIMLKSFYDALTETKRNELEDRFQKIFIYFDNDKIYIKLQWKQNKTILSRIINFKENRINKMETQVYETINANSDVLLLCYKYFYDKFIILSETQKNQLIDYLFSDKNKMICFDEHIENKTFCISDNDIDYNACVGQNGINDIYTYIQGYKLSVDSIYNTLKGNYSYGETLIYPLCFSARHFFELSLKHITRIINEGLSLLGEKKEDLDKFLKKTHNLLNLFVKAKELAINYDYRILGVINGLSEYVMDFSQIDLSGETFRYPFNQNDEHSLDSLSCININIFYKRFNELDDKLNNCQNCCVELYKEYKTGTFIKNFGRNIIEQISNDLPPKQQWVDKQFDDIRLNLIDKYNLKSMKNLSKIITIILKHPEFASRVGVTIQISSLTKDKYNEFKEIANKNITKITPEICSEITNAFSNDDLNALLSFKEVSDIEFYSEDFDRLYKHNSDLQLDIYYYISHLFYYPSEKIGKIENGIKKCGQLYLL